MKIFLLICAIMVTVWPTGVAAFDNELTHPQVTERAITISSLDKTRFLQDRLGLVNGTTTVVNKRNVIEWLREGSRQEDEPACRASNHFHNPLRNWTESGMRDEPWFVSLRCILSDYPSSKIKSNVVWATGYTAPIADNAYKSSTGNTWIGEQRKSVLLC